MSSRSVSLAKDRRVPLVVSLSNHEQRRSSFDWLRTSGSRAVVAIALVVATLGVRAELPEWVRDVDAGGRFHDALFRTVATPSGPIEVRRTPAEAYDALGRMPGGASDVER